MNKRKGLRLQVELCDVKEVAVELMIDVFKS